MEGLLAGNSRFSVFRHLGFCAISDFQVRYQIVQIRTDSEHMSNIQLAELSTRRISQQVPLSNSEFTSSNIIQI